MVEGSVNPYGCTVVKSPEGWEVAGQSGAYLTNEHARLVVAGSSADSKRTLAYSIDGKKWLPVLSDPFAGLGVGTAAACGADKWVATGTNIAGYSASTCTIAYSTNGLEWTPVPNDPFAGLGGIAHGVAFNGLTGSAALWIAVGTNATNTKTVATSTNGIAWTTLVSDPFGTISAGTATGVAYGGGKWVIVGSDNIFAGFATPRKTVATSSNGTTWALGTCEFDNGGYGTSVAYNGTTWVIGGRNQLANFVSTCTICKSSDSAVTWVPVAGDPFIGTGLCRCNSVAWNGTGVWMAVGASDTNGSEPTIAYANPAADNWIDVNNPPTTPQSPDFSFNSTYYGAGNGVTWSNALQLWVAVGTDGLPTGTHTILVSTDSNGNFWEYASNNPFGDGGRANGVAVASATVSTPAPPTIPPTPPPAISDTFVNQFKR